MAYGQYDIQTFPRAVTTPDGKWVSHGVNNKYESLEFSIVTGTTNYNVGTQVAGAFGTVATARKFLIRTDFTISLILNATTNNSITLTSLEGALEVDFIEVTNFFITNNSGSTANIKILMS